MEETLPRSPESISITQQDLQRQPNMCTLTVTTPSPHSMFRNEYSWDSTRPSLELSRPRAENKAVSLPSIRQTFPELNLDGSLPEPHANRMPVPRQTSASVPGSRDTSEYVHSPNSKRRRISIDDEQSSLRAKQVPRLYRSPERPTSRQLASPRQEHALPGAPGSWTRSPRSDSYGRSNLSARLDAHSRPESRSTLPALPPPVKTDLDHPGSMQRLRDPIAGVVDRTSMYHAQDYPYAYQQPGRYQSVSSSPARPFDRAPFSAGTSYGPPYSEMARYGNLGGMGMGADAKQRKRRGNLPKETTDKLRAWFVAHLQHPYPTEDEKQELMRQTGLQMNQISNWFINARRRQLPAMINSARVESDATNGRVVGSANTESKILASTEHNGDYGAHSRRAEALPLSDGESAAYDDDMSDGLRKRRAGDPSRESV